MSDPMHPSASHDVGGDGACPLELPRVDEPTAGSLRGTTAVAMSGGLDSSVVAWSLSEQGESVIGLSMLLWDHSLERRNGRCCGALDLGDAKRVAEQAGVPHYTLRMDREFREHVVDPFVNDYLSGRTPSPCVRCNTWIKFDLLLERAMALGADSVATGHYARIVYNSRTREYELHEALDRSKDQTYFLFELTQDQLRYSRFPLGELTKEQVRAMARRVGLVVAEKGESMEVCFVTEGVREFVEGQVAQNPGAYPLADRVHAEGSSAEEGAVLVSEKGEELGRGAPYYRYTVGQRKGLGVAADRRLYVLDVDPEHNTVRVGDRDRLLAPGLEGERLHWIGRPPDGPLEATVRIRSRHQGVNASIEDLGAGRVRVRFDEPQSAVTPGQAAVFYDGSRVLGGCWIESALPGT